MKHHVAVAVDNCEAVAGRQDGIYQRQRTCGKCLHNNLTALDVFPFIFERAGQHCVELICVRG